VVLKRRSAPYAAGRAQGDWWRWTSEPHHLAVVLMYAHAGQGARSGLFTDCTFGVWHAGSLAPIVRAPAELTQAEVTELEAFVREHTISKHGPVRRVEPKLVFELIFEGARRCGRRRSGVALRQARIVRWCRDRPATEADSLGKVLALTGDYGAGERTR
jgi:DNA ligase-1